MYLYPTFSCIFFILEDLTLLRDYGGLSLIRDILVSVEFVDLFLFTYAIPMYCITFLTPFDFIYILLLLLLLLFSYSIILSFHSLLP